MLVVLLALFGFAPVPALAATLTVDRYGSGSFTTIQSAIDAKLEKIDKERAKLEEAPNKAKA
jgi:hypothetical protein